jgi:hypothetical protein
LVLLVLLLCVEAGSGKASLLLQLLERAALIYTRADFGNELLKKVQRETRPVLWKHHPTPKSDVQLVEHYFRRRSCARAISFKVTSASLYKQQ